MCPGTARRHRVALRAPKAIEMAEHLQDGEAASPHHASRKKARASFWNLARSSLISTARCRAIRTVVFITLSGVHRDEGERAAPVSWAADHPSSTSTRASPLWPETAAALHPLITKVADGPIFRNARGEPKLTALQVISFALREHLPSLPMTPQTFIQRVLSIRGRKQIDRDQELIVLYENPRDPLVNEALHNACSRLNQSELRREHRRLRFAVEPAPATYGQFD